MSKPNPSPQDPRPSIASVGATLVTSIVKRYRTARSELSGHLDRGERDYAKLSQLSQEIGKMRQKIRAELERRRAERRGRKRGSAARQNASA